MTDLELFDAARKAGLSPVRAARYVRHARQRILKIPTGWAWATDLADAFARLRALHPA